MIRVLIALAGALAISQDLGRVAAALPAPPDSHARAGAPRPRKPSVPLAEYFKIRRSPARRSTSTSR